MVPVRPYLIHHDRYRSLPACRCLWSCPSVSVSLSALSPRSSDGNRLFELLIEKTLSALDDVPPEQLPVIVIVALDEYGGLRHDASGRKAHDFLLRTLQQWIQDEHLKRLFITSRPEDRITRKFPESISTFVNIPSGKDVMPGDSGS